MRILLIMVILFFAAQNIQAQKILKLYKGDKQALEFFVGDEITFKLKDNKDYYTFPIKDLFPEQILFSNGMIPMKNIEEIKTFEGKGASKMIGGMLQAFAGGWVLFSGVDLVFGDTEPKEIGKKAAIVTGTSLALSFLVQNIFGSKKHKIKGRKFLQMVDLTPQ